MKRKLYEYIEVLFLLIVTAAIFFPHSYDVWIK